VNILSYITHVIKLWVKYPLLVYSRFYSRYGIAVKDNWKHRLQYSFSIESSPSFVYSW